MEKDNTVKALIETGMDSKEIQTPLIPVMLYDGDCGFCQKWIRRWERVTGNTVKYLPYQQERSNYPHISEQECKEALQLIMPNGRIFSGAHAVFHAFALARKYRWLLWCYEYIPLFGRKAEVFYQLIAKHRSGLSKFLKKPQTCNTNKT